MILVTLVGQGLSLPFAIRVLGLESDAAAAEREEAKARVKAAEAASGAPRRARPRGLGRARTRWSGCAGCTSSGCSRFSARFDDGDDGAIEERSADYQRLRRELLEAERRALVELRRVGRIGDEIMNPILRDLDLEETRLDR